MAKSKIKVEWTKRLSKEPEGVIVGCSKTQETLLPWWWMNFRLHNNLPVTFINFGDLSNPAINWCKRRGNVITLNFKDCFVAKREDIDPSLATQWEQTNSYVWIHRPAWFRKPFALLKSPYRNTLWIDLDCQVRGSLKDLFSDYLEEAEIAMAPEPEKEQQLNRERGHTSPNEIMYNAGVIAFNHGCPLILEWAKRALDQNHLFIGDQQLLVRILHDQNWKIEPLPLWYNWPVSHGFNPEATILHWWGSYKAGLLVHIENLEKYFYINLSLF